MTTSGGAGTTFRSANSSTFPDVLYTPASLIGSELSVYLAPAFMMRVLLAALYWGTGSSSTNAAFTLPCCALRGTSGGETMTSPGGGGHFLFSYNYLRARLATVPGLQAGQTTLLGLIRRMFPQDHAVIACLAGRQEQGSQN
jgi:hypothetical protein